MDLIYTNASWEDLGVLQNYEFDLAFGADENNFTCKVQATSHCCEPGSLLYIEGTEYGGIIDEIESDTGSDEVTYSGRTWHGILNSKVLVPGSGSAYLYLSGDANTVLANIINRLDLKSMFSVESASSGITLSSYQMDRYISGYDGIRKMLKSVGAKLKVVYTNQKVVLSAVPLHDYYTDEEFDSDLVAFNVKKKYNTVNHLVCLGSGELEERMVVNLYADKDGNISQKKTQTGMEEYTAVYDYPNVESQDELISSGTERLKELCGTDEIELNLDADSSAYDVGDIVGAVDNVTNISASARITKKIVTIQNGAITISYEVGES